MPTLIDGYNVLHQSALLGKGRGPGFLERARQALVRVIAARLGPEEAATTTIVFDSKHAPYESPAQEILQGVTILYSHGYESADELLEELIRRAPQPRLLLVVSSDRRVQQAARRRRAKTCGAEEWLEQLERPRNTTADAADAAEKPAEPATAEELEYWRRVFDAEADGPSS